MLLSIRERAQGVIAMIIIGLLVLTFALWGVQNYLTGDSERGVVAKVNGEKLMRDDLNRTYEKLRVTRFQSKGINVATNPDLQKSIRKAALNQMIVESVMQQAAKKLGYRVSANDAQAVIMTRPEFQTDGQFSYEKLDNVLRQTRYSIDKFFKTIQSSLALDQWHHGMTSTTFALPNEVNAFYQLQNETRDYHYFLLTVKSNLAKPSFTTDEINAYYQAHLNDYQSPEEVSMAYLQLDPKQYIKHYRPTIDALQSYLDESDGQYKNVHDKRLVKDYIRQHKDEILADASERLVDLTYTTSDSLQPAADELKMKVQTTGFMQRAGGKEKITQNPKVLAVLFSDDVLNNGNNSSPIEMEDGSIVVVRILQHHPAAARPLHKVRKQVIKHLQQQAAEKKVASIAKAIATKLNDNSPASQLATNYKLIWHKVTQAKRSKLALSKAVFAMPTLTKKAHLVTLPTGDVAVVQVDKVHPANPKRMSIKERKAISTQLSNHYGDVEYNLMVQGLMKEADIKRL